MKKSELRQIIKEEILKEEFEVDDVASYILEAFSKDGYWATQKEIESTLKHYKIDKKHGKKLTDIIYRALPRTIYDVVEKNVKTYLKSI